uniref:SFRICE_019916 n=1 Tax=Spodoptera frugiperda TaxID=7108 RepID=A0A2H1VHG5_SPOFR
MNFLEFPVEIGVTIFNYLDTKTKINVYNCSEQIKEYFALGCCFLTNIVLSRSTLATVKTLNEKLFLDLAEYIRNLNLSGVQDLTVQNLKPHIHRFVNLKSLDITFTNIYLTDIEEVCPAKVKNIGINFFRCPSSYRNDSNKVRCRNTFKERQFEAVHLVVFEYIVTACPLLFLKGLPMIKKLKVTISGSGNMSDVYADVGDLLLSINDRYEIEPNFNQLTYQLNVLASPHRLSKQLEGVSRLIFSQLEYICIRHLTKIDIYVSPIFINLFTICCTGVEVTVSPDLPPNFTMGGYVVFKAWNKATTKFDKKFFDKVLLELKDYFPTYVCMHNQTRMQLTNAPSSWFCIDHCVNFEKKISDLPEKVTLTDFCRLDGEIMRGRMPISLSWKSEVTHRLTFLSINNILLRRDFFVNLFTVCPKLVTLDVYIENEMIRDYTKFLSRAIHLAKLKNFMLISDDIDYNKVFSILSKCTSLENVHIRERERVANREDVTTANIVVFIQKCVNLYSLFIEADMTGEGLTMLMAPLRIQAQMLGRDYLCIEVCESYSGWNPFQDVFNPSPLQITN